MVDVPMGNPFIYLNWYTSIPFRFISGAIWKKKNQCESDLLPCCHYSNPTDSVKNAAAPNPRQGSVAISQPFTTMLGELRWSNHDFYPKLSSNGLRGANSGAHYGYIFLEIKEPEIFRKDVI